MKEQLETLVEGLAHVRLRPYMYFSDESPTLRTFMDGFSLACALLGVDVNKETEEIWNERGWKDKYLHPITLMRKKGLSDDEINAEVFAVLILALQRKYDVSNEPVLKVHSSIRESLAKTQTTSENPSKKSIYSTEAAEKAARELVEHTLRAMDTLEKEMDSR
jgi:hypothetical protein